MDSHNQEHDDPNIQQRIMEGQLQSNPKTTTYLFTQLLKEFKLYYLVAIIMNLLLGTLFTVQYIRQCNEPSLTTWILYSTIIFFLQFIFYIMVILPSYNKQKSYYFAEQLNEVIFEGDQDPYFLLSRRDRTKKRKRIENLIRSHFKNYKKIYWYIDLLLTLSDLGLVVLGVVYFSMNDYFKFMFVVNKTESFYQDCEFSSAWITFWSIVLICISRKSAFQLLLLVVISLPIIVCYVPIKLMKQNKQKSIKNRECLKVLKSIKYHPNTISGDDHSCSICRMDYSIGVSIKVLPCSNLHHFHSSCIKAWFRISATCPLCRKELGEIIDDIRSNNGTPSYLILDIPSGNSQINQDIEQQDNLNGQNAQQSSSILLPQNQNPISDQLIIQNQEFIQ